VDGLELEPACLPRLALCDRLAILVVQLRIGVPDFSAGPCGQLERADDVILVPVGLQDVGDAQVLPGGLLDVDIAIAPWIDDDRVPAIADDVRVVGQALRFDTLE
jgi:hypothetical protein